ncbi:MAG: hypothetical protein ACPGEG_02020 [Salibacteraceae bacterium]
MGTELIFEGPLYGKEQLLRFIPQRNPIVMMDDLIDWNTKSTTSALTITDENIFTANNEFSEPGVIENFAQTMALRIGYHYYLLNQPAPVGYIGSFKKFSLTRNPLVGEKIKTTIEVLHELFGVTMAKGIMYVEDEEIARIEMKTVVAKED